MKNRLHELRIAKHYSQIQLQIALEIDQANISKIESGQRNLTAEQCKRAALFFGTSIDYMIYLTDERSPHIRSALPFSTEHLSHRMETIIELREKLYTQAEISKLIGIDQSNYSKVELGKRYFSLIQCVKLAFYLNISVDYLLGLTDDQKPYPRSSNIPK